MIAKLSPGEKALVGPQMEAAIADQGRRTTVTIAACQNDKWSDEVVGCLADAKEAPVRGACMKKLQPEQLERLKKALYGPM